VLRWLLVLYVLSLGTPVFQAFAVRAAAAGVTLVELCTEHGIQQIAIDSSGLPVDSDKPDHQSFHHCGGCLTGSPKVGLHSGSTTLEPVVADVAIVVSRHAAVDLHVARAIGVPLPPRGPPPRS
jgi:hypothetical protein